MLSSYETDFTSNKKYTKILKEFVEITADTITTGTLNFKKELNYLKIFLKGYKDVKQLNWNCDQKISQGDFLKILNLMPNLTNLKLRKVKLEEDKIEENPRKKLKLDLDICKNLKLVDSDDENVLNFFSLNFAHNTKLSFFYLADYKQLIHIKSPQVEFIKKLKIEKGKKVKNFKEILKFSNLEELEIWYINFKQVSIKEISSLKNLKVLTFQYFKFNYSIESWKCLEDFENLEELNFDGSKFSVSFLRDLKLKSLKTLSLEGEPFFRGHEFLFENLSINFPNLKVLKVHNSPHKINFYAKHFKNLEKLHLEFSVDSVTNSIEFDTGIVNKNLKELKVLYCDPNFDSYEKVNDFFEIVEIFPNLETIETETDDCDPFFANKFLFAKLNKLKNLKSLQFKACLVNINRCLDFIIDGELIDDLKSLSRKLESYYFEFTLVSDKVIDYKKVYDICGDLAFPVTENERENFELFLSYLREHFEVDYDEDRDMIVGHRSCR